MSGLLHAKPQQVLVEPPSAPVASPQRVFIVEATHTEQFAGTRLHSQGTVQNAQFLVPYGAAALNLWRSSRV